MCVCVCVCVCVAGFPGGTSDRQVRPKRHRFNPWVGKIPWRRKWQPTPVFLTGKSHEQSWTQLRLRNNNSKDEETSLYLLCMVGFCRIWIPKFGLIKPLHEVTKVQIQIITLEWGEQGKAFNDINQALTTAPALSHPSLYSHLVHGWKARHSSGVLT